MYITRGFLCGSNIPQAQLRAISTQDRQPARLARAAGQTAKSVSVSGSVIDLLIELPLSITSPLNPKDNGRLHYVQQHTMGIISNREVLVQRYNSEIHRGFAGQWSSI